MLKKCKLNIESIKTTTEVVGTIDMFLNIINIISVSNTGKVISVGQFLAQCCQRALGTMLAQLWKLSTNCICLLCKLGTSGFLRE